MTKLIRAVAIAAAFTLTLAVAPTALHASPVATFAQDRDQQHREDHPEYRRNRYYRTGNREGYQDYQRKNQRPEHTHRYRNDDDRKAHDYGYQQGWQGQRGYTPR